jgi:hypothetical protein
VWPSVGTSTRAPGNTAVICAARSIGKLDVDTTRTAQA